MIPCKPNLKTTVQQNPLYLGLLEQAVTVAAEAYSLGAVDLSGAKYGGKGTGMYLDCFGMLSRQLILAGAYVTATGDGLNGGPTYKTNGGCS